MIFYIIIIIVVIILVRFGLMYCYIVDVWVLDFGVKFYDWGFEGVVFGY